MASLFDYIIHPRHPLQNIPSPQSSKTFLLYCNRLLLSSITSERQTPFYNGIPDLGPPIRVFSRSTSGEGTQCRLTFMQQQLHALCQRWISETNALIPGSLLSVRSMITTPLHGPLRARLEPSPILDLGRTTEIVGSRGQEDCAHQHHLSAPIPAAQVNVTSGHNILGKKRKLDQGKLSDVDAVDGDKGENPLFYVYRWS